jgi:murein DD-endopeptidase MepM/ murein hydrolase activator NlpD
VKSKNILRKSAALLLAALTAVSSPCAAAAEDSADSSPSASGSDSAVSDRSKSRASEPEAPEAEKKFIRWMKFDVPENALRAAMNIDIKSHSGSAPVSWVDILAYLGAKYGGNWKKYKASDLMAAAKKLSPAGSADTLSVSMKYFSFYREAYGAVLSNFLGDYTAEVPDGSGDVKTVTRYGLKAFSPIAKGYGYSHYRDFGASRSFGYSRPHLGNDLLGSIGTPIVAVEGGIVESLGWNRYGGWRVGIRSFDSNRYYYYAHLRRGHPYAKDLRQGSVVRPGDVIGYLGMTGYSDREDVNNMTKPHLHFGMQIIFDESQKDGSGEIWIDVYDIVNLLSSNRSAVVRDDATKDYRRAYDFLDLKWREYYGR